MANLITGQFRRNLESARDDVFDTFSRELTCFKTPEKTILDTSENYSFSYDAPDYSNDNAVDLVSYSGISGKFQTCIQYDKSLERLFANPQGSRPENFRIIMDDGMVRLKVKSGDYNDFIKDSVNIQFDGYQFEIFNTERPHGLFSPKYYTLYLKFRN